MQQHSGVFSLQPQELDKLEELWGGSFLIPGPQLQCCALDSSIVAPLFPTVLAVAGEALPGELVQKSSVFCLFVWFLAVFFWESFLEVQLHTCFLTSNNFCFVL